ncbi:hypothetical protein NDU88_002360 [Pleurodeles waltl]|uniref:Uncharacterized protein n=1 Tax=Pleurodeles waltl TaxID=8319 RepID=A0AAV7WL04_PLEWA|nr:hypothetical protein NDU88_002360 [Pleurodeles waltl]
MSNRAWSVRRDSRYAAAWGCDQTLEGDLSRIGENALHPGLTLAYAPDDTPGSTTTPNGFREVTGDENLRVAGTPISPKQSLCGLRLPATPKTEAQDALNTLSGKQRGRVETARWVREVGPLPSPEDAEPTRTKRAGPRSATPSTEGKNGRLPKAAGTLALTVRTLRGTRLSAALKSAQRTPQIPGIGNTAAAPGPLTEGRGLLPSPEEAEHAIVKKVGPINTAPGDKEGNERPLK